MSGMLEMIPTTLFQAELGNESELEVLSSKFRHGHGEMVNLEMNLNAGILNWQ